MVPVTLVGEIESAMANDESPRNTTPTNAKSNLAFFIFNLLRKTWSTL
jgi:hypothetical protein